MPCRFQKSFIVSLATLAAFLAIQAPRALAQHGSQGTVTVTVLDASGSVVPGAQLELRDLATNDLRAADTQPNGTYTFVNLDIGRYQLSVRKGGFQTQIYGEVVVQAAQTTDIKANLKVAPLPRRLKLPAVLLHS